MSKKIILIAGAGVAILALLTKPNRSKFVEHIKQEMKKDGFLGTLGSALVPFVFHENNSSFHDCLLFSFVEFEELDKKFIYVGVFGKWIRIK